MRQMFIRCIFLISGIIYFGSSTSVAQNREDGFKVFKIWVQTMDGQRIKGYLHKADSLGITLAVKRRVPPANTQFIPAENIQKIKLRRKGSVGKGAGFGLFGGAAFGAILGYSGGDTNGFFVPTAEQKAGAGAILFGFFGSGVGALLGTSKRKMVTNGNRNMYYLKLALIYELQRRK